MKKPQSIKTKLRYARAEIKTLLRDLVLAQSKINRLCETGGMMSNVCYNLSQDSNRPKAETDMFRKMYKQWDIIEKY